MTVYFRAWLGSLCGLVALACSHTQDAGKASRPSASTQSGARGTASAGTGSASEVQETPGRTERAQHESAGSLAPVAVVELFTSEGCSSCPSADRVLAEIEEQRRRDGQNVIALAFHVDYWNRLGWKDRFSARVYSDRQRWYALHEPEPRVYTPQMIVQGREEFIGSHRDAARRAIQKALGEPARASVSLEARDIGPDEWNTTFEVRNAKPGDHLTLALLRRDASTRVVAGENAGNTLRHVNVVVDYARKSVDSGRGSWRPRPQPGVAVELTAFVQDRDSFEVLGAQRLTLAR